MKQYKFVFHYTAAFMSILVIAGLMAWLGAFEANGGVTAMATVDSVEEPAKPAAFPEPLNETDYPEPPTRSAPN